MMRMNWNPGYLLSVINKKIDKAKSFPFMSEHSNFIFLKLEQMSATQFEKQSGYEHGTEDWDTGQTEIFETQSNGIMDLERANL
jgi:hypothetical protein